MRKLFSALKDAEGKVTKGYEIYVNPLNVTYCEASSSGNTTYIYFTDGRSVEVCGKAYDIVSALTSELKSSGKD